MTKEVKRFGKVYYIKEMVEEPADLQYVYLNNRYF